jgi:hypothetical protein
MNATFRNETTASGYNFSVVKSGLQKYIRRGMEEKALKCAEEIDRFAELGKSGERLRTNMIHRLQIIFLEDIGLGNYELWKPMESWIRALLQERTKPDGMRNRAKEIELLECIVRSLCRSNKTRAGSYMNAICTLSSDDILSFISEIKILLSKSELQELIALEPHLRVLNQGPVNMACWFQTLDRLLPSKDWACILYVRKIIEYCLKNDKKRLRQLEQLLGKYISLTECLLWKKDLIGLKESFLLYLLPLGKYLFGTRGLDAGDMDSRDTVVKADTEFPLPVEPAFRGVWPCDPSVCIDDDFVFDKHVNRRHVLHKDMEYFAHVSSIVIPEVFIVPDIMKSIYVWLRTK